MATEVNAYGAPCATEPLVPLKIKRRSPREDDVSIKIAYCGICHTDIHTARNEWKNTVYPCVPGHEVVGHVTAVGPKVTKFKVGDAVAVGCFVDSCANCDTCRRDLEPYCLEGVTWTSNSQATDGSGTTYGGYSTAIVVKESFVLRVPSNLNLAAATPLLCAGITMCSPLRHWGVGPGSAVGIVGLGGLGHMGVRLGKAMGAEVTVFTTSPGKVEDAKRLGATHVVISKDPAQMQAAQGTLDVIIDTISASHDLNPYMMTLKVDGTHVLVGIGEEPNPPVSTFLLVTGRKQVGGSLVGGPAETQEMLDFCGKHNLTSDIEMTNIQDVNKAYERVVKSDVKYRFVIDMASLQE